MTDSITFAKFEPILEDFANFQKFRLMKESGKMLEPQVNCSNMSQVSHACLKLSFLMKRHSFGDVWKISSDLDAIWWVTKWTNTPQRKTLKSIKVKSGRLQESTNMNVEYSTLSFFINDDWFDHFCKVSTNFRRLWNFQKFRLMKESGKMLEPQVSYSNMSQVSHAYLKLSFLIKRHCFGDVWKISSDLDAIWWVAKWTNTPQRKTLKGIKVKSGRLQESTDMNVEYSTLSFFINDDWLDNFCKVWTNFGRVCKLSKIQEDETN